MFTLLTLLLCLGIFQTCADVTADAATPLLQEGKKTLYQRVISHPGAKLHQLADEKSPVVKSDLRTFTPLYVYERGEGWISVGVGTDHPQGWIRADRTTPWNQSMTLLFTPKDRRDPVLFFDSIGSLTDLCSSNDFDARLAAMRRSVAAMNPDPRIVAAEPADSEVNRKSFYLMPILDYKEVFEGTKFLEVASIDPRSDKSEVGRPRSGIAIVMDTTISMGPYLERCKDFIRTFYDQFERDKLIDDVAFAVVAFRNSVEATPGAGYRTRIISDFTPARDRAAFEASMTELQECKVSTHSFAEDSLAGVHEAITKLRWADYDSRLILLVTDASPLPLTVKYHSVDMGPEELSNLADKKGIWLVALHLMTPAGKADFSKGQTAYRALTTLNGATQYRILPAGDTARGTAAFEQDASPFAKVMSQFVTLTSQGKLITRPRDVPSGREETAEEMAARIGYAMQLDYLGRKRKTAAPDVVKSWIADMDLQQLAAGQHVPNVKVAVMLTKDQLSDLARTLQTIIYQAERTRQTDARDFFQSILSASARTSRDPGAPATAGKTLAQLGVLGEFLDGLPYRSEVMLLTEEDWYRKSVGEQTAFINRLKSKLDSYLEDHSNLDLWERFDRQHSGEWVCRMPLTQLP